MLNQKFLKIFLILIFVFKLSACFSQSKFQKNQQYIAEYRQKIKEYNCKNIDGELNYVNKNLDSLKIQFENSKADRFFEFILTLGLVESSAKRAQNRIELFEQKKSFLIQLQQNKKCI
ncbi:MAG: hypothetical protein ACKO46_01865 [Alphaproteobacteria bacterium]